MLAKSFLSLMIFGASWSVYASPIVSKSITTVSPTSETQWPQLEQVFTTFGQISSALESNNIDLARELTGQLARYSKILASNPVPQGWDGAPSAEECLKFAQDNSDLAYQATTGKLSDDELRTRLSEIESVLEAWKK